MKVIQEQVKPVFKPITITIETEEEAKWMWARLCMGRHKIIEGITYLSLEDDSMLTRDMWKSFNDVYRPEID